MHVVMTSTTRPLTADTLVRLILDTDPYLSCDDCFAQMDEYIERRALSRDTTNPGCEPIWTDAGPAPKRPRPC
jgi:hypothetical protein